MPDQGVVVGAGLVGLLFCLAHHQARLSARLDVINDQDPKQMFDDPRPLVINAYSQNQLVALGLWSSLQAHAHLIDRITISAQGHLAHASVKDRPLGWVIPAGFLYQTLYQAVSKTDCRLHIGQRFHCLEQGHDGGQVVHTKAESGQSLALPASWVVAADGVHSSLQAWVADTVHSDGMFHATVFHQITVKHRQQPVGAHQRFTPSGSVALLPLAADRATVVWTQRQPLPAQDLWLATQKTFARRVTMPVDQPPFVHFSGMIKRPDVYAKNQVFLVGNAAHALPPIAAQGFNLGVRDVTALVALMQANASATWSADYQQARARDIKKTYERCLYPLVAFEPWRSALTLPRSMALWALDGCSLLKKVWVDHGMGIGQ